MTTRQFALSVDQVRALRARYPHTPDQSWIPEVVRTAGWEVANPRYLASECQRSQAAMRDLLASLGIEGPQTPEEAVDLVALALQVFIPGGSLTRQSATELRIEHSACPTLAAVEAQRWHGITACASWHRRRGWLDALGAVASDSVLGEMKWGDPACVSVLQVNGIRPQ